VDAGFLGLDAAAAAAAAGGPFSLGATGRSLRSAPPASADADADGMELSMSLSNMSMGPLDTSATGAGVDAAGGAAAELEVVGRSVGRPASSGSADGGAGARGLSTPHAGTRASGGGGSGGRGGSGSGKRDTPQPRGSPAPLGSMGPPPARPPVLRAQKVSVTTTSSSGQGGAGPGSGAPSVSVGSSDASMGLQSALAAERPAMAAAVRSVAHVVHMADAGLVGTALLRGGSDGTEASFGRGGVIDGIIEDDGGVRRFEEDEEDEAGRVGASVGYADAYSVAASHVSPWASPPPSVAPGALRVARVAPMGSSHFHLSAAAQSLLGDAGSGPAPAPRLPMASPASASLSLGGGEGSLSL
jgi:hypothetical protein